MVEYLGGADLRTATAVFVIMVGPPFGGRGLAYASGGGDRLLLARQRSTTATSFSTVVASS